LLAVATLLATSLFRERQGEEARGEEAT
jgi:hypothetical protein